MATYIALLRGINVGGHKLVKMVALQKHFEAFGATMVQTYIQSGNVIFEHGEKKADALRKSLEAFLEQKLGFAVPTLIRSAQELAAVAKGNPFDTALPEFGKRMYVCFFERAPAAGGLAGLKPYISEQERFELKDVAGYAYFASGLGTAKLTNVVIERKLGLATMRNWNTVNALLEMARLRS